MALCGGVVMPDRVPPQSLEAESALLGSILVDRASLAVASQVVEAHMLYAVAHESIYRAMLDLDGRGQPIDKITVGELLRERKHLEKCGGMAYLGALMETVPTSASVEYYATIVREKAQLRMILSAGRQLVDIGFEGESDVDRAAADAERILTEALRFGGRSTGRDMPELIVRQWHLLDAAHRKEPTMRTPWPGVTHRTGGALPGETWVIAASPAVGKSAATSQMTDFIAAKYGRTALFALEMGEDSTMRRLVAMYSKVTARKLRSGQLRDADYAALSRTFEELNGRPITMFGPQSNTLREIRKQCQRLIARDGELAAVVIDHANFIADVAAHDARLSKHAALDRAYTSLALMAKEMQFWLILVQHTNRGGMKLGLDKSLPEPSLSDIRDGGNIEGLAQVVIFPHREFPYSEDDETQRRGKMIVAKSRDGSTGSVEMDFVGARHLWLERYASGRIQQPWFEAGASDESEMEEPA